MPLKAYTNYTNDMLQPYKESPFAHHLVCNLAPGAYVKGQLLGEYNTAAVSELQTITVTGGPTGGSRVFTFDGLTTAAVAWNSTAAQLKAALDALANISAGDLLVAGGPHPATAITVTFQGRYSFKNVPAITVVDALTGGASPATVIATTTQGAAGLGTYDKYNPGGGSGLNVAKVILKYPCVVDSSGRVAIEHSFGNNSLTVEAWVGMLFLRTTDIIGLDAAAVTALGARVVEGSLADGIIWIP